MWDFIYSSGIHKLRISLAASLYYFSLFRTFLFSPPPSPSPSTSSFFFFCETHGANFIYLWVWRGAAINYCKTPWLPRGICFISIPPWARLARARAHDRLIYIPSFCVLAARVYVYTVYIKLAFIYKYSSGLITRVRRRCSARKFTSQCAGLPFVLWNHLISRPTTTTTKQFEDLHWHSS